MQPSDSPQPRPRRRYVAMLGRSVGRRPPQRRLKRAAVALMLVSALVGVSCSADPSGGAQGSPSGPAGPSEAAPAGPSAPAGGAAGGGNEGAGRQDAAGGRTGALNGEGGADGAAGEVGAADSAGGAGGVAPDSPLDAGGDGSRPAPRNEPAPGDSRSSPSAPAVGPAPESQSADASAGSDPAPLGDGSAPPIAPVGPRFPEPLGLTLTRMAQLPQPLALAHRSGEPESLYVALRHGEVIRLRAEAGRADTAAELVRDPQSVLDISGRVATEGEMGLLGLVFSPTGDRLYTSSVSPQQVSELWEWPVAPDGSVDVGSGRLVLWLQQPFWNHNGGDVTFGLDGHLYLGFGDGGGGGDPLRAGQEPQSWLGSILRIDPRPGPGGEPYTIPADNPFADGVAGAPEVWLWGVRNPWRFSFDRANGDLWVADVGQDQLEEVNRLPAAGVGAGWGANLGWSAYEGSAPYWSNDEPPGHVRPTVEYRHGADERCSVTGGYVYRGAGLPGLGGVYIYSDFCDGTLWGYTEATGARPLPLSGGEAPGGVLSFGQGPNAELYVLTAGGLWRLEAS